MKLTFTLTIATGAFITLTSGASGQNVPQFQHQAPRIIRSETGAPVTPPSKAAPRAIIAQTLRELGRDEATVNSIVSISSDRVERTGVTHLRFEQRVAGLSVYDTYVKASLSAAGEIIQLIDALAPVPRGALRGARVDAHRALAAALARLHPEFKETPAASRQDGNTTVYARGRFFHADPTVTRVAVPLSDGSMTIGYLVETWTEERNLLNHTLIGGDGDVLFVEPRTTADSYNIFQISPERSAQTVVAGPAPGGTESPAGWLFSGDQRSVDIAGNNAHAYLDALADNAPDSGGTIVADGNFLTTFAATEQPSTVTNKNVAVQNLFYLNNVIHDELYRHGFTEAAGNFQENNFSRGGRGSDSVNAEAQDGSGTDNANFATPPDGKNPRMQMFLWSPPVTHEVFVHSPKHLAGSYNAKGAAFGAAIDKTGVRGLIALANDGVGTTSDACEAMPAGSLAGMIALIDRGSCTFVLKVKNAQNAGAMAAIVANNQGDSLLTMGGADATITIGAVFIGQTDGGILRSRSGVDATVRLLDPAMLSRDGDLDSDIVWHEYGHGLTWRMIGRMSGPISGAIGEGMSDTLAILINGDDRVAEYSFSDPRGIRSAPYTNYPRTYGDVAGTGVHFDGEVYGAIGWRLGEIFRRDGLTRDRLFGYLIDGMNYTPAGPTFEDMRDGILQAVAAAGSPDQCRVWEAFAAYGVGVGAKAQLRGSTVLITESFEKPASCP